MSKDEMNETNVLPMTVKVWVCCLLGPVLSVAAAWQFGGLLFPGRSPGLLFLVLLLLGLIYLSSRCWLRKHICL